MRGVCGGVWCFSRTLLMILNCVTVRGIRCGLHVTIKAPRYHFWIVWEEFESCNSRDIRGSISSIRVFERKATPSLTLSFLKQHGNYPTGTSKNKEWYKCIKLYGYRPPASQLFACTQPCSRSGRERPRFFVRVINPDTIPCYANLTILQDKIPNPFTKQDNNEKGKKFAPRV